ncbi:MAG: hypothetical protein J2P13_09535, partial [Acidobacteria bacterium]|nr:hypothetical protein [Acidobacteriota bacterium]
MASTYPAFYRMLRSRGPSEGKMVRFKFKKSKVGKEGKRFKCGFGCVEGTKACSLGPYGRINALKSDAGMDRCSGAWNFCGHLNGGSGVMPSIFTSEFRQYRWKCRRSPEPGYNRAAAARRPQGVVRATAPQAALAG